MDDKEAGTNDNFRKYPTEFKHPKMEQYSSVPRSDFIHRRTSVRVFFVIVAFFSFLLILITVLLLLALLGIIPSLGQQHPASPDAASVRIAGRVLAHMDRTADPCVDFQQYACGGWEKETHIQDEKYVANDNDENAEDIMQFFKEQLSWKITSKDIEPYRKAQKFYASCIRRSENERDSGVSPVVPWVRSLGGMELLDDSAKPPDASLAAMLAAIFAEGIKAKTYLLFGVRYSVSASAQNTLMIHPVMSSKYGPLRGLYGVRDNDKRYTDVLSVILKVQRLFFPATTEETAKNTLKILIKIAKASLSSAVFKTDLLELLTVDELTTNVSNVLDWNLFIEKLVPDVTPSDIPELPVYIYSKKHVTALLDVLAKESKRDASNAVWTLFTMRNFGFLSEEYRNYRKKVLGTRDKLSWRQCVSYTTFLLKEPMESLFIERYFENNKAVKKEVKEMVNGIRKAFIQRIQSLNWLDQESKRQGVDKATNMLTKIAYPDKLLNQTYVAGTVEGLNIGENFFGNAINATYFKVNNELRKLYKPFDHTSYTDPVQSSKALYIPNGNYFVVYSGYLQTPFYDRQWPSYMKYGAAGMVIGHEITHGFDSDGCGVGKRASYHGWCSTNVSKAFTERAQCFVDQISQYEFYRPSMNKTMKVDGQLTLSENIADAGGLRIAYQAYKAWTRIHGEESVLPGFPANVTVNQLFFLAAGQMFCSKFSDEYLSWYLQSDGHVPWTERANTVMMNSGEFSKAYNCQKSSRLNPIKKCQIW